MPDHGFRAHRWDDLADEGIVLAKSLLNMLRDVREGILDYEASLKGKKDEDGMRYSRPELPADCQNGIKRLGEIQQEMQKIRDAFIQVFGGEHTLQTRDLAVFDCERVGWLLSSGIEDAPDPCDINLVNLEALIELFQEAKAIGEDCAFDLSKMSEERRDTQSAGDAPDLGDPMSLSIEKTLAYYDLPLIFTAKAPDGRLCLWLLAEESDRDHFLQNRLTTWLALPINEDVVKKLDTGETDFRSLFLTRGEHELYVVDRGSGGYSLARVTVGDIPESWLPGPGVMPAKNRDRVEAVLEA